MSAFSRLFRATLVVLPCGVALNAAAHAAHAQNARFELRAEPDVIAANGISTTSIFVQVPSSRNAITPTTVVRFATTAGVIENQATLTDGVARVLLRSAATPGTAVVTAFIGSSREAITVEFSSQANSAERYLEMASPYVAYGSSVGILTSSGKGSFDYGDIHIESDVRLDVDLYTERVWAQGNKGGVIIRQGRGARAKILRGDRLFFDLKRRSGVMRRADGDTSDGDGGARQEFFGSDFAALPPLDASAPAAIQAANPTAPVVAPNSAAPVANIAGPDAPAIVAPAAVVPSAGQLLGDNLGNDAPQSLLDTRQLDAQALSQSGAVAAKKAQQMPATAPNSTAPAASNAPAASVSPAPKSDSAAPDSTTTGSTTADSAAPDSSATSSNTNAAQNTNDSAPLEPSSLQAAPNSAASASSTPATEPSATESVESANSSSAPVQTAAATDPAASGATKAPPFMTARAGGAPAPGLDLPQTGVKLSRPSAAPGETQTQTNPLVASPAPRAANGDQSAPDALPDSPAYKPLPDGGPEPRIVELPPPSFNVASGYWVVARRLRVFPRKEIQFEHATTYFNGGKAFKLPLYVLPLDGSFNPTTDLFAFNSAGGVTVRFPFYYQASKSGTGTLFVRNDPGNGFSTTRSGPSLELNQQYTLSPNSRGRLNIDQIGTGPFNVNFQHQLNLNPTTTASLFLNMPRHRDLFARAALAKTLRGASVGIETFYDVPQGQQGVARGQMFARLRPKTVGKTGFTYTVSANLLAISRVATTRVVTGTGLGGGVNLPGEGSVAPQLVTDYHSLLGQTLTASLQAPLFAPWKGGQFTGSLLTTAFNYSDGRRGVAPGVTLGYAQRVGKAANVRVDYTYDRSSIGLYGATGSSFTNYLSASLDAQLSPKIGFTSFLSQSLNDRALYGSTDLSYRISSRWRAGVFADYSSFAFVDTFNYGWSLARSIGQRELSLNYDAVRSRVYFQVGNARL